MKKLDFIPKQCQQIEKIINYLHNRYDLEFESFAFPQTL